MRQQMVAILPCNDLDTAKKFSSSYRLLLHYSIKSEKR